MDKAYAFFAASNEPLSVHSMDSDSVVHKMDMVMDVSSIPRYISAVRRCVASKVSQRISGWKQSFPYSGESGDTQQPGHAEKNPSTISIIYLNLIDILCEYKEGKGGMEILENN